MTREELYIDSILSRLTIILATMREKMIVERKPSGIPIENVTNAIVVIDIIARVRIRLFSKSFIPIQLLYCSCILINFQIWKSIETVQSVLPDIHLPVCTQYLRASQI